MTRKSLPFLFFALALAASMPPVRSYAQDEEPDDNPAVLPAGGAPVGAAPAAGAAAGTPAPRPRRARRGGGGMGTDKAGIETYLKSRLAKIKIAHKARMDFNARETEVWTNFWNKVKDERNLFEVRIARQRLDLFESMASLEANVHQGTISDFEKLQSNVVRAFESQQRQKMAEFFSERERKVREFAVAQEKERQDFTAEVEASWQALKATFKPGK